MGLLAEIRLRTSGALRALALQTALSLLALVTLLVWRFVIPVLWAFLGASVVCAALPYLPKVKEWRLWREDEPKDFTGHLRAIVDWARIFVALALQVLAFGHGVRYGAVGTYLAICAGAAFGLTLCSRVWRLESE